MGGSTSKPYESKEKQIQQLTQNVSLTDSGKEKELSKLIKAKRDGTFIRSKEEIGKNYDESLLPWPIAPIVKLDYCWRVTYTMWKHSFILAFPLTMCHFIWQRQPQVWTYTLKTLPKLLLTLNYLVAVCLINTVNITFSLMFEDYCNRYSLIYNPKVRNSHALRKIIRETNEENRNTLAGKSHKALTPEEILTS